MKSKGSDNNSKLKASASVSTPDLGIDPHDCLAVEPSDPCTIVILGATGDLTARKLVPALFELYLEGGLPQPFQIMGCGRTELSSQAFRSHLEKALISADILDRQRWPAFASAIQYQRIEYDDLQSYLDLAASLKALDIEFNTGGNRIFYVALPPMLYMPVAQMIGRAGLSAENQNGNGWSRIVIEKPFGTSLKNCPGSGSKPSLTF